MNNNLQSSVLNTELINFLRNHFRLTWKGIHGAPHWARVRQNGLILAAQTGANTKVIEIFAFFHDVERIDDGFDDEHGYRSAALVKELNGELFSLSTRELDSVVRACEGHSKGDTSESITVMTCWDADRLDLGRIGIRPDPNKLCTDTARNPDVIEWAWIRSLKV